jgi:hypothetical protein
VRSAPVRFAPVRFAPVSKDFSSLSLLALPTDNVANVVSVSVDWCTSLSVTLVPFPSLLLTMDLPSIELAPAILLIARVLRFAPLRSAPLRSAPLRSAPLRSAPLRSAPLRFVPLRGAAVRLQFGQEFESSKRLKCSLLYALAGNEFQNKASSVIIEKIRTFICFLLVKNYCILLKQHRLTYRAALLGGSHVCERHLKSHDPFYV